MIVLYLIIGFLAAIIAAMPPGAANIIVIKTSLQQTFAKVVYIIIGAGLGEVILASIALHCTMNLSDFFTANAWVQISVFVLFILIGIYFLLKNKLQSSKTKLVIANLKIPKFLKGLLVAFLNPPVLIFWVLGFSLIHKHLIEVSDMSPWIPLVLFFTGVFLGKIITLYTYSLWGKKLGQGSKNAKKTMSVFIGTALVVVGVFQGVRFFIS